MTKVTTTSTRNIKKRLTIWAGIVAAILMIPLLAKAPWTGSDFVFGAIVLYGSATLYELATVHMKDRNHRIITGLAVLMIVIFIWGLAVSGE